jgi:hypothetical protein
MRVIGENFIDRHARAELTKKHVDWNARPSDDRFAIHDFRGHCDSVVRHGFLVPERLINSSVAERYTQTIATSPFGVDSRVHIFRLS